jgi:hypothetical protein
MHHRTTVEVDTETGERAVIDFDHDTETDVYTVAISGAGTRLAEACTQLAEMTVRVQQLPAVICSPAYTVGLLGGVSRADGG